MSKSFNVRATLRAARGRTAVPVLGLCLGLLAAQPVTRVLPETYEASATMVITATGYDPTTRARVPDPALAQNLAPTVAQLVQSREVAVDAAAALGLPSDAAAGHLTGSYERGTQIITVKATARGSASAAALANAAIEAVERQFSRLQISVGGDVSTKSLDRASPPSGPTSPDPRLDDVLGALAGLLAGLGLAWVGGRVDDRLRGPARLGAQLGLPVLGILPRVPRRYARHNARTLYTRRSVSDAMGGAVATLSVFTANLPCRRLLVTSVRDDDGKAVASALLALALAEGSDRVTLIEGQPRRPALGGHFPEAAPSTLQKAVVDGPPPSLPGSATLSVVVAGRRQKRSEPEPEPVSGGQIGEFVDAVAGNGDIAVVHAPPVLAGAELASLSRHGDGVVLVVETGVTRKDEARRAAMLVRRMNLPVVGVLVIDMAGDAVRERYVADEPAPAGAPVPAAPWASLPAAPPVTGSHAAADGESYSASRAARVTAPRAATARPAAGRQAPAPVPAPVSAVRTVLATPVQVHPAPVRPAPVHPAALHPAALHPAAIDPGPGPVRQVPGTPATATLVPGTPGPGTGPGGPDSGTPDSAAAGGPDARDGRDGGPGARHRRRDRLDALSAPFEALLTETEEFTSPLAVPPDLPPEKLGDGERHAGGWAATEPSWQPTVDRPVPDSRQCGDVPAEEFA